MTRQWLDVTQHHGAPTLWKVGSQACTAPQFSEPDYDRLCAEIKQAKAYHRKQWEYVYILRVLESYNLLRPGVRGIGFACGKEPLAAVDRYVDLPPYEQKVDLKLMVDKFVTTSFGFVIVKNGGEFPEP